MSYFEALWQGMTAVLAWPAFGLLLLGIAIGIVIGFLPGLGTALAFALLLPFIFDMTPVQAIAFLLGMYALLNISGEVTAILFAVPGVRSATAAIMDGHPMVKQGQAGRAIGASLYSSLIGGIFGLIFLMVAIPVVRPLVLAMGNPELFMLIVFAVVCVAALSRERLIPGLISGAIGFVLGMVGQSRLTGESRFTFGSLDLWEGFPIIAVALGIFAVPEIIQLALRRTSLSDRGDEDVRSGLAEGGKDNIRHWRLVLGSSLVGTLVGLLPGLGSSATQWIVYSWAKERSKTPERFGKGAVEGVIAPGAATNSDEGGALTTTLAFGVPGSIGMAFLLTAFIIVGVAPGPPMLNEHLDVTMALVWTMFFAHVIGVGFFLLFARHIVKLTKLRSTITLPFILSLVLIGGYLATYSLMGIVLTLAVGVVGYLMVVLNWPRPPLILAFVLSPLAENYLWLSHQLYGFSWLTHPIVLGIATLTVGYVVYIMRRPTSALAESAEAEAGALVEREAGRGPGEPPERES